MEFWIDATERLRRRRVATHSIQKKSKETVYLTWQQSCEIWIIYEIHIDRTCMFRHKKSVKHWGLQRNGGGKVVGVVPTKNHLNRIKIAKVCFWGGFCIGGDIVCSTRRDKWYPHRDIATI